MRSRRPALASAKVSCRTTALVLAFSTSVDRFCGWPPSPVSMVKLAGWFAGNAMLAVTLFHSGTCRMARSHSALRSTPAVSVAGASRWRRSVLSPGPPGPPLPALPGAPLLAPGGGGGSDPATR